MDLFFYLDSSKTLDNLDFSLQDWSITLQAQG